MSVSVTQISVSSESGGTFFLKVDWVEDLGAGFTVALCDGESAWMGEVSEEEVQQEAEELEMRKESYVKELQLALTGVGRPGGAYSFQLSPESGLRDHARRLTFKKVQRDISFRLGSVELLPCPEPDRVIKELIGYGLQHSSELQAQNQSLLEQNQRLRCEQDRITAELEKYAQGKETLERELYTRFVLLLNAKKAKIRQLQERLGQLQEQGEIREKSRAATSAGTAGRRPVEEEVHYEASSDEETPNLALSQVSTVLVRGETSPRSSDLELSDTPDVAPNRKRRWRHLCDPGSEVTKGSLGPQRSGRKDPAHGKAVTNQDAAQECADVATPSPKADSLFEGF